MKKIEQIITDEDGEQFVVVGECTRLGALRAMRKEMRSWGLDEDAFPKSEDDLEYRELFTVEGGEHDGWIYWKKPEDEIVKPYGVGWYYTFN